MNQRHNQNRLAIFPLSTVLFPQAELNLHIFEDRYKKMFEYILLNGSKFGVVHFDEKLGGIAQVGCVATVEKLAAFPDGRLNAYTIGSERFRILDIVKSDPFLLAEVELIAETAVDGRMILLASELRTVIDDVLKLSSRVYGRPMPDHEELPADPVMLSYMVPSSYYSSPVEQQKLLSLDSAQERLVEELSMLTAARKHLAALSALQKAVG